MKKSLLLLAVLACAMTAMAARVTITSPGLTFSPASVTINQGDTVVFSITASHNAVEVSQATYNANGTTALPGGFSLPFGGGILTGLSVGTHYYVCTPHAGAGMKGIIIVNPAPAPRVWINEVHYDNTGVDTLEGIEIAGVAGANLSCFRVYLYNGNGGAVYDSIVLSGSIDNEGCGYGALWFGVANNVMQNGAPDAIALVYRPSLGGCSGNDSLLYFISYEGSMSGIGGFANAVNSTDMGVSETSASPVGSSLQLGGQGTNYSDFFWQSSQSNTNGSLNTGQFICSSPPPVVFNFTPTAASFNENADTIIAGYVSVNHTFTASSATMSIRTSGSTGTAADINSFTPITYSFSRGGNDSIPVRLRITNDLLAEGNENIRFGLGGLSSGAQIGADSIFTLTIIDDDATATVAFQSATSSIAENGDSIAVTVNVSFSPASPSTVNLSVSGTATNNSDYNIPASLNIPANYTGTLSFTVRILNDAQAEGNESIIITLSNPSPGLGIGAQASHTITITDDDISVLEFYPNAFNVDEFVGIANAPVRITTPSVDTVFFRVVFDQAASSATRNVDFQFNDTTLFFLPNTGGSVQVPVQIIDDQLPDGIETLVLKLSNPSSGALLGDSVFTFTIDDNDTVPRGNCENLFFSEYLEGTSNNKAIEIYNPTSTTADLTQYRLIRSTNGGVSFSTLQLNGSLAAGSTYLIMNPQADASLLARANQTTGFINFNGNDALALLHFNDTIDIFGQLYTDPGATGWAIDTGSSTDHVLIRSRYVYKGNTNWNSASIEWKSYAVNFYDSLGSHGMAPCGTPAPLQPVQARFASPAANALENSGTYQINVVVTNPNAQNANLSVSLNTASSTATQPSDFTFSTANISAAPGVNAYPVTITLVDDASTESSETVVLNLQSAFNPYILTDSVFTLTIQDDDGALNVSFSASSGSIAENGGSANMVVRISQLPSSAVTADVVFAGGSASAGTDFTFTTTTVNFGPGLPDSFSISVPIINDNLVEGTEVAQFLLQNVSGGAIVGSNGSYTLTITDDESSSSEDMSRLSLKAWPNPASEVLMIEAAEAFKHAAIYNVNGELLYEKSSEGLNRISLAVNPLPAGLYVVRVSSSNAIGNIRFQKQ